MPARLMPSGRPVAAPPPAAGRRGRIAAWLLAAGLAALVLLQAVARMIPPMQSPDEGAHVVRALSLVDGHWAPETRPGEGTGLRFDIGFAVLARAYYPLIGERDPAVPAEDREAAHTQGWTGQHAFASVPGAVFYMPAIYLPVSAGLAVGRATQATVMQSYQLGRLAAQLFCVAVLALSAWLWRPPLLALGLLLLPMSLFQMASPVIDGVSFALTMLVMALYLRLRQEALQRGTRGAWGAGRTLAWSLLWCLALVSLVTARLQMAPLLLLPLALALEQRSRAWALAALSCGAATVAWVLWALRTVVDPRVQRELSTLQVAREYLMQPRELWAVFERSLANDDYLRFLGESFIGRLGWLDVRLAEAAYGHLAIGLALLAVIGVASARAGAAAWGQRLLMLALAASATAVTFLLLLFSWSPYPAELIEGVQGRYLIGPALVAAHAWAAMPGSRHRPAADGSGAARWLRLWLPLAGLALFATVSVAALHEALAGRYPAWALGGAWP